MKKSWYIAAGALVLAVVLLAVPVRPAAAADFNGDGVGDIAIFRPASGLWAVRGVTRFHFGASGDIPVPGDYNGNRVDDPAIFRPASGLWAVRGVTRVRFGRNTDQPIPGDYTGNGTAEIAIFRPASGLWAVRGVTRFSFGRSTDMVIDPGPPSRRGLLTTGSNINASHGDDGQLKKGAAFNYQTRLIAGDLVTIDNVTGLMWAADGNAAGCYNGGTRTWWQAVSWAGGLTFAGYSDWRLPNRRELESIVNTGRWGPAIDPAYFPNTWLANYWSSTSEATADWEDRAWRVGFNSGWMETDWKTQVFRVRAVRDAY